MISGRRGGWSRNGQIKLMHSEAQWKIDSIREGNLNPLPPPPAFSLALFPSHNITQDTSPTPIGWHQDLLSSSPRSLLCIMFCCVCVCALSIYCFWKVSFRKYINKWPSVSLPPSVCCVSLDSVQGLFSFPFLLWASFSSSLPSFPLLAFLLIIIACVCMFGQFVVVTSCGCVSSMSLLCNREQDWKYCDGAEGQNNTEHLTYTDFRTWKFFSAIHE